MSQKQLKNQAFRKGLLHPTLRHDGTVPLDFSSLRCVEKYMASAHEVLALCVAALSQWGVENDSVLGAYAVCDLRNFARLQIGSVVLDLEALMPKKDPAPPPAPRDLPTREGAESERGAMDPESEPASEGHENPPIDQATSGSVSEEAEGGHEPEVPKPPRKDLDPARRRRAMLEAKVILQDFAAGGLLTFEDVEERIQNSSDQALVRNLVTGVRRGSVTRDADGDISWSDVQPIKQKLPMRTELIVDAELQTLGRLKSRKLQLVVSKVHTPEFAAAVQLGAAKVSGVFEVRYDSKPLAKRILLLTAIDFPAQYRATVMRGLAGDAKYEFQAFQADPIVNGQLRLEMSNEELAKHV